MNQYFKKALPTAIMYKMRPVINLKRGFWVWRQCIELGNGKKTKKTVPSNAQPGS